MYGGGGLDVARVEGGGAGERGREVREVENGGMLGLFAGCCPFGPIRVAPLCTRFLREREWGRGNKRNGCAFFLFDEENCLFPYSSIYYYLDRPLLLSQFFFSFLGPLPWVFGFYFIFLLNIFKSAAI